MPQNQDVRLLSKERRAREDSLRRKKQHVSDLLQELVSKHLCLRAHGVPGRSAFVCAQVSFKNLIKRNRAASGTARLQLPYVLVRSERDAVIQLEMSEDRKQVFFNFRCVVGVWRSRDAPVGLMWCSAAALSHPFQIEEDKEIMRQMGLPCVAPVELQKMVPPEMVQFYPKSLIFDPEVAQQSAAFHLPGAASAMAAPAGPFAAASPLRAAGFSPRRTLGASPARGLLPLSPAVDSSAAASESPSEPVSVLRSPSMPRTRGVAPATRALSFGAGRLQPALGAAESALAMDAVAAAATART